MQVVNCSLWLTASIVQKYPKKERKTSRYLYGQEITSSRKKRTGMAIAFLPDYGGDFRHRVPTMVKLLHPSPSPWDFGAVATL